MSTKFFSYKRVEPLAIQVEGQEQQFKTFIDLINLDKVIRVISLPEGQLLVLLDDIHTRTQEVPMTNKKKEVTGYKKENIVVQSEIYLFGEDIERFYKLTE